LIWLNSMNIQKVIDNQIINAMAYIVCVLFITAGSFVSLNRFWQYEVFYYDFGIFDQAIWSVAHFKAPIIDHLAVGRNWIFADHFNPSIFIFSPLYWFTDKSEILLIAQSIFVGLSGIVLYSIGNKILKNFSLSLSVLVCYLFFIGLQNAIISDFHEVTVSVLPLMLTFWAVLANKKILYFLFLIITLGFKESIFVVGIGIGLYIFLTKKEWKRISVITIVISLLWGIISIKFIIPYFSGGIYQYLSLSHSEFGNPFIILFDSTIKRRTLFYSFLSFGFLPLLSPQLWFLLFQDFYTRFVPYAQTRWYLGLHYNAQSAVFFGIGSFYGILFLNKIQYVRQFLPLLGIILIINAVFLYRFILHGPFGLFYNPAFYKHTRDFTFLDELIKKVPKNSSVMTQNNLAVRFTHQNIAMLQYNYSSFNPDYVLIDLRKGQNPNNFFTIHNIKGIFERLRADKNYHLIYSTNEQYVYKHINII